MAFLDITLGKAVFRDQLGHAPNADSSRLVRDFQASAFSLYPIDATTDWVSLVEAEGGVFFESGWLYPDWTGGALMDSKA